MAKREFLQLAHVYRPEKHRITGWFYSTKLDGIRAFWDGGISRGISASEVPWANTEKDHRLINPPVSTGMWTRLGKVIHAPDCWLNELPSIPLDGELYCGTQQFQRLTSIVKRHTPDPEQWSDVTFQVFDSPLLNMVFNDGEIKTTHFRKEFSGINLWLNSRGVTLQNVRNFEGTYKYLKNILSGGTVTLLEQIRLPFNTDKANQELLEVLDKVTDEGGEGLVLRKPESYWEPCRSHNLLKVKKSLDDEGIVVGYTTGRQTDLGSKLRGKMGALILNYKGKRLELSGFTDQEREFRTDEMSDWAYNNPGVDAPDWVINPNFPRGSVVTFRYRELSTDGIPKEARYDRKLLGR